MKKTFLKNLIEYYNPKKEIQKYLSMLNYATQTDLKPVIFDFSKAESLKSWEITSDEVYGGFSRCSLSQNEEKTAMQFTGTLSTTLPQKKSIRNANLGPPQVLVRSGYAGCRSIIPWQIQRGYFLNSYDGLELVVKGDNRTYNLNLYPNLGDSQRLYALQFQVVDSHTWKTFNFKFRDFAMVYNGKVLGESPIMYHNKVQAIGISLQDGLDGDFNLDIGSIAFTAVHGSTQPAIPSFEQFWKKKS